VTASSTGSARERTELAWNRTALSAGALAALLLKVGIDHSRPLDVLAGASAVLAAATIAGLGQTRARWLGNQRVVIAGVTLLVTLTALLTVVAALFER
jgi:Domain of unknown function (DUF202)